MDTQRREPLSGTCVYYPTIGTVAAALLMVDQAEHEPRAWEWREEGIRRKIGRTPYFDHNHVTLNKDETCDFVVVRRVVRCLARWRVVDHYEIAGHPKAEAIPEGVTWFLTSGEPPAGFSTRLQWAWSEGSDSSRRPRADSACARSAVAELAGI